MSSRNTLSLGREGHDISECTSRMLPLPENTSEQRTASTVNIVADGFY